jgi:hypothetical protein
MLPISYGEANFENLRRRGSFYLDKTRFIPLAEKVEKFFFIRPRRFGKSLWISILSYYYDINSTNKFEELFHDLYIQKHPTKLKNSYLTLYMNFSGIYGRTYEEVQRAFDSSVQNYLHMFLYSYKDLLALPKDFSFETFSRDVPASEKVKNTLSIVKKTPYKIYVLIDEYDHFVNTLVSEGKDRFVEQMINRSGFVRSFYEQLKIGSDCGIMDRFFITGVSPIMLDELSSGFNIMSNMSTNLEFNEMLGFTEEEVLSMLDSLPEKCFSRKDKKFVFEDLLYYYNGYKFHPEAQKKLFNSDMVLYFFQSFREGGRYPEEILDLNVKTDYGKLKGLIVGSGGKEQLREIIEELATEKTLQFRLVRRFTFENRLNEDELKSLLYFFGLLTMTDTPNYFKVPNYVIQQLHWEYLQKFLQEKGVEFKIGLFGKAIADMAERGDVEKLKEITIDFFHNRLSSFDFAGLSEKHIKFFYISYFTFTNLYNVISEREITGRKRIDLLLEAHPAFYNYVKYNFIIELKYIKKTDSEEIAKQKREEAISQAKEYYEIYKKDFNQFGRELRSIAIIVTYTREVEFIEVSGFEEFFTGKDKDSN